MEIMFLFVKVRFRGEIDIIVYLLSIVSCFLVIWDLLLNKFG